MAWTAWLVGKNETADEVQCQVEFRSDVTGEKFVKSIPLSPATDGITDQASATLKLRQKVSVVLNQLSQVAQLGTLVAANIGAQVPAVALSDPGPHPSGVAEASPEVRTGSPDAEERPSNSDKLNSRDPGEKEHGKR